MKNPSPESRFTEKTFQRNQHGTLHDNSINLLFSIFFPFYVSRLSFAVVCVCVCVCVAITAMELIIFTKKTKSPAVEHKLVVPNFEKGKGRGNFVWVWKDETFLKRDLISSEVDQPSGRDTNWNKLCACDLIDDCNPHANLLSLFCRWVFGKLNVRRARVEKNKKFRGQQQEECQWKMILSCNLVSLVMQSRKRLSDLITTLLL